METGSLLDGNLFLNAASGTELFLSVFPLLLRCEDVSSDRSLSTFSDAVSSRTACARVAASASAAASPVAAPGVAAGADAGAGDRCLDCLLRSTCSSALRLGGMAGESPASAAAAAAAASECGDPSDCPCEVAASRAPRSRLMYGGQF